MKKYRTFTGKLDFEQNLNECLIIWVLRYNEKSQINDEYRISDDSDLYWEPSGPGFIFNFDNPIWKIYVPKKLLIEFPIIKVYMIKNIFDRKNMIVKELKTIKIKIQDL